MDNGPMGEEVSEGGVKQKPKRRLQTHSSVFLSLSPLKQLGVGNVGMATETVALQGLLRKVATASIGCLLLTRYSCANRKIHLVFPWVEGLFCGKWFQSSYTIAFKSEGNLS